eukprot:Gregarina_sp_Poly_1__10371@NODE_741_length_6490_cov_91_583528_g552_i0_p5_GENE_NODE_741_length_6490_cov_91_583528_g552_i0NODE_741_length_6490_cov_91_583528_g552_i0_p5_ORF_typecomplete_len136_score16_22_NODE_741_length_6490_cov_91_583528_g552_i027133120
MYGARQARTYTNAWIEGYFFSLIFLALASWSKSFFGLGSNFRRSLTALFLWALEVAFDSKFKSSVFFQLPAESDDVSGAVPPLVIGCKNLLVGLQLRRCGNVAAHYSHIAHTKNLVEFESWDFCAYSAVKMGCSE